jgi:hypothetical protein
VVVEKLHDWDPCDFYFLPNLKEDEVGGACGTHNNALKCVQGFGGKPCR